MSYDTPKKNRQNKKTTASHAARLVKYVTLIPNMLFNFLTAII